MMQRKRTIIGIEWPFRDSLISKAEIDAYDENLDEQATKTAYAILRDDPEFAKELISYPFHSREFKTQKMKLVIYLPAIEIKTMEFSCKNVGGTRLSSTNAFLTQYLTYLFTCKVAFAIARISENQEGEK